MTMKKVIAYAILISVCFVLQSSFFSYLQLADVVPNLLIILTASAALINGSIEGCLVGFFSGLLLDVIIGPYLGLYALGFTLCGYLAGIFNRIFYKEDITFPVLVIAASDLFYGFYLYLTGFLIRGRLNILFYIRRIILPEAVYTVIVGIFLYRIILFIIEHLQNRGSENSIEKDF